MQTLNRILVAIFFIGSFSAVSAQDANDVELNIEQQPLSASLREVADTFDLTIAFYSDSTDGLNGPALDGEYTSEAALDTLLADTNLEYMFINDSSVAVRPVRNQGGDSEQKNLEIAPVLMAQNTSQAPTSTETPSRTSEGGTSIVTGKVTDARTGANLKGAKVTIEETGQWTSTNDLGGFRLVNVPTGSATLTVSYLGYAGQSTVVGVRSDGASHNFALRGGSEIEEIIVFGQRSARALALNMERSAENVSTVVSADLLGSFDGTTISESLRRTSGVAFQQDALTGDGTNVIVRGLEPDLNTITLNGARLPVGNGEDRSADLSNLLTESISKITISKTLLANQDSSGTGGLVDIETKGIDGPLKFTAYANILDNYAVRFAPGFQNGIRRGVFDQYVREKHDIQVDFQYYYAPSRSADLYREYPGQSDEQIARHLAREFGLDFDRMLDKDAIDELVDLGGFGYGNFWIAEFGGRKGIVRNFDDSIHYPGEAEVSATLKSILETSARIGFFAEESIRRVLNNDPEGYYLLFSELARRDALENDGFEVVRIERDRLIPADIDVLVLAEPLQQLSAAREDEIKQFIDNGGNLLIAAEPGGTAIAPIADYLGIQFGNEMVVQPKRDYKAETVFSYYAGNQISDDFVDDRVLTYRMLRPVLLTEAVSINVRDRKDFDATPLLIAAEGNSDARPGANENVQTLAMFLERERNGKSQRILAVGDADFFSSGEVFRAGSPGDNYMASRWAFTWLSGNEYPIDLSRPWALDTEISLDKDTIERLKLVLYFAVPGLIIAFGASFLFRRRRR